MDGCAHIRGDCIYECESWLAGYHGQAGEHTVCNDEYVLMFYLCQTLCGTDRCDVLLAVCSRPDYGVV